MPRTPVPHKSPPARAPRPAAGAKDGAVPIVTALRKLVRRLVPEALETTVWGAISFHRPRIGGRVKGAVCQIVVKDGRVRLDFIHGIRLADPSRLLRGDGLSKRHVPIATVADARRPAIAALIREAAAVWFDAPRPAETRRARATWAAP